ncbi:MAG: succinylglutamate desuccinylase/aspartoacylase family protein [Tagaea sp.]
MIERKLPPIEVRPRDLARWRASNSGVEYVHVLEGSEPGPTVMTVGLTHGNEFCGAEALHWALDLGLRPLRGTWIAAFANVEAYRRFDANKPLDSRFVDRDMNRVWRDDWIDGEGTREAIRAGELRPFVQRADFLLDIHSTSFAVRPFYVGVNLPRVRALAARLAYPKSLLLQNAQFDGKVMVEYGAFADPASPKTALVVECGAHFLRGSVEVAKHALIAFLDAMGTIEPEVARRLKPSVPPCEEGIYEIEKVHVAKSAKLEFLAPYVGFEEVAKGTKIAMDGADAIEAPFDRCTVLFPKANPAQGREFVTLARRVD